mgnify:CR=1 FL=1|tara:strand:+ start:247 stop:702 length:456 start_codon:yes stop_codon:yes gene_type:complete
MARQKSDKSQFRSIYSGGYVTDAQYITEALFYLISKSQKIDLPENFWNDDEWSKKFQYQIVLVNRLLKKYSPHAILKTLRDKRCWSVYSFGIFLHKNYFNHKMILDMFQKEIEYEQNRKIEFTPSRSIVQKPRIKSGKKNILSLLKEVDNE